MAVDAENSGERHSRRKVLVGCGIATLLLVNATVAWRRYSWARQQQQAFEVCFTGPFVMGKALSDRPLGNTWIQLQMIRFIAEPPDEWLAIEFHSQAETSGIREVHARIALLDTAGTELILQDLDRPAPGTFTGITENGAYISLNESFLLPIPLEKIAQLTIRFTPRAIAADQR